MDRDYKYTADDRQKSMWRITNAHARRRMVYTMLSLASSLESIVIASASTGGFHKPSEKCTCSASKSVFSLSSCSSTPRFPVMLCSYCDSGTESQVMRLQWFVLLTFVAPIIDISNTNSLLGTNRLLSYVSSFDMVHRIHSFHLSLREVAAPDSRSLRDCPLFVRTRSPIDSHV